jgi:hypothetical protein
MIRLVFCLIGPGGLCRRYSSVSKNVFLSKAGVLSSSSRNSSETVHPQLERRKSVNRLLKADRAPQQEGRSSRTLFEADQPTAEQGKSDQSVAEQGKAARLVKMTESWERNDHLSFMKHFTDYSEVVKFGFNGYLSGEERKTLSWMLKPFIEELEEPELATVLKCLANCGFTATHEDLPLLAQVKSLYLKKATSLKEKNLFLSALSKFKFVWKTEERKSDILHIVEMSSFEITTPYELTQLLSVISRINIPWKLLTLNCQENIIKKFLTMKNERTDPIDTVKIIHSLSSIDGLKMREMTKAVSSMFLLIAKNCLSLNGLDNEQQWTRQVHLLFTSSCSF